MSVHFSSKSSEWQTPPNFAAGWVKRYALEWDVACTTENRVTKHGYCIDKGMDGLAASWLGGRCWMNPPYGRGIINWVRKAYEEGQQPNTLVCALLPARTDTKWWHLYVMRSSWIFLVKGRLRFVGAKASAPFPSCVVIFEKHKQSQPTVRGYERPTEDS